MVQCGKAMMQHNEIAKIMGQIANGLGVISVAPSGSFIKVAIKARLLHFLIRKEMKMKRV
jgi:hypothetical protein